MQGGHKILMSVSSNNLEHVLMINNVIQQHYVCAVRRLTSVLLQIYCRVRCEKKHFQIALHFAKLWGGS